MAIRSVGVIAGLVAATLLAGCTTLMISEQGGAVRVERHFGFVSLEVSPGTKAIIAETTSLGYLGGPMGVSIGYGHNKIALLPDDCRLVVWLENPEQLRLLRERIGDAAGLCVVSEVEPTGKESSP